MFGGPAFAGPLRVGLVGVGLLLVAFFHFWPLFFVFWWVVPFFLLPALGFFVRGIASRVEGRPSQPPKVPEDHKEKELLEAIKRHGEITPAWAALETSLSVSEADRMLSELAKNGHIEVRAREGRLGYALWDRDRRELTDD
jgi:hypothetical protein